MGEVQPNAEQMRGTAGLGSGSVCSVNCTRGLRVTAVELTSEAVYAFCFSSASISLARIIPGTKRTAHRVPTRALEKKARHAGGAIVRRG